MSAEPPPPKFCYVVVSFDEKTHAVMVVHDDTPEWYRRVATFSNKRRAEVYADVENDCRPGGDAGLTDEDRKGLDDDVGPAPAGHPSEPRSAFDHGVTIERSTRLEYHQREVHQCTSVDMKAPLVSSGGHPAETSQTPPNPGEIRQNPSEPDEIGGEHIENDEKPADLVDTEPPIGEFVPKRNELVDVATLQPLTEKQAKVFKAICDRTAANMTTFASDVMRSCGYGNVQDALRSLDMKGYTMRVGERGAWFWKPLAKGEPKLEDDAYLNRWTEEQMAGLLDICTTGGDFEAYAKQIGRTLNATTQQARSRGWYREWQKVTAARDLPKPAQAAPQPVEKPQPAPPSSTQQADTSGDDEITINDLSARAKAVLKALCDAPYDENESKLAAKAGVEFSRVPFLLNRLRELGCIGSAQTPTMRGRALAAQIEQPPTLVPAVQTKILYPVVRRNGPVPPVPPTKTAVVGDPEHDRSALAKRDVADKLGIVSYLKKKGHDVQPQTSGLNFKIDGKFLDIHQAIEIVNKHRAQAPEPLPPISLDGISVA